MPRLSQGTGQGETRKHRCPKDWQGPCVTHRRAGIWMRSETGDLLWELDLNE